LCNWTAQKDVDWFIIDPPQGTSNLITVTVQDNLNGQFRQGDITVRQNNITKIITIKQTGSNDNSPGACCQGSYCTLTTFDNCVGGDFKGAGTNCISNPCGGGGGGSAKDCCDYFIGPCCTYPSECQYKTPQACKNSNGIFLGFNQTCDNCPS